MAVVWRTDLYKEEAFRTLNFIFYSKIPKDNTLQNQKIVKETINKLILKDKLPKTASNLIVKTPKTSTFYLRPKIHKPATWTNKWHLLLKIFLHTSKIPIMLLLWISLASLVIKNFISLWMSLLCTLLSLIEKGWLH